MPVCRFSKKPVACLLGIQVGTNFGDLVKIVEDDVEVAVLVDNIACFETIGYIEKVAELSFCDGDRLHFFHILNAACDGSS
jgi:hypothetical protein